MKLKDRIFHTDLLLLTGLFFGVVKTGFLLSHVLFIPDWLDSLLTLGLCGCFGLHVLLQRPGILRLAAYAAVALTGAYSSLLSNDMGGLITILTCIALIGCDFDRVIGKLFLWSLGAFLVNAAVAVILALIHGPDGTLFHTYVYFSDYGINRALSLGYDHKNVLGMNLFNIYLMWCWWRYPKLSIGHFVAVTIALAVFLLLCQCKTTVALLLMVGLVMGWFLRKKKESSSLLRIAAGLCPAVLLLFSFVCTYLYQMENAFALLIDRLLTGRISLCAYAWENYGLTLFGHPAENLLEIKIPFIDNAYFYSLAEVGAIWIIGFCIAFFLVAKRSKDPRVHLAILCWAAYSMVEVVTFHGFRLMPALLPALLLAPSRQKTAAASQ